MKTRDYEYEIVLRVVHHEPPNPDEPSLNIGTFSQALVDVAMDMIMPPEYDVTVKRSAFLGEVPRVAATEAQLARHPGSFNLCKDVAPHAPHQMSYAPWRACPGRGY